MFLPLIGPVLHLSISKSYPVERSPANSVKSCSSPMITRWETMQSFSCGLKSQKNLTARLRNSSMLAIKLPFIFVPAMARHCAEFCVFIILLTYRMEHSVYPVDQPHHEAACKVNLCSVMPGLSQDNITSGDRTAQTQRVSHEYCS